MDPYANQIILGGSIKEDEEEEEDKEKKDEQEFKYGMESRPYLGMKKSFKGMESFKSV